MSFTVGIGSAKGTDDSTVAHNAAIMAKQSMPQAKAELLLLFASSHYEPKAVLKGVQAVFNETPLIGCTTAGEITSQGPDTRSVVIVAINAPLMHHALGVGTLITKNEREAGQQAARQAYVALNKKIETGMYERTALIVFPDGMCGIGKDFIRGTQEVVGTGFPIIGGASGDDFAFKKTYQFMNDTVFTDAAPVVLLGGSLSVGIGISHGWHPLGKPRLITRSFGNVIMEIDGKPAITLYEEYFGRDVEDLAHEPLAKLAVLYPLGMSIERDGEFLVRNAIRVEQGGALVCAGEVYEGATIRLLMGSRESSLNAAKEAAQKAIESLGYATPQLALVFDSMSRAKLLGRDTRQEIALVQAAIGPAVPLAGFYTYGEQAPLKSDTSITQSHFHNGAIAVLVLGE